MTHEDNDRQYQPQDGSGEPHSKGWRMTSALPTHPDPNNIDIPMTSTTQAQVRPSVSPDDDEDEIGNRRCKKEERNEKLQYMVGRFVQRT
jgi:hypothetical protein